ncbi:hypothetical protein KY310_00520 [Candidatus Woesearchaeota archaeon]|nr:hypothetical protein [Candidatus Woesearchaeota archaeon]
MSNESDITLEAVRKSMRRRPVESIGNLIRLLQKKGQLPTSIEELKQKFEKILADHSLPAHKREQELLALMLELETNQRQIGDMRQKSNEERAAAFYDALTKSGIKATNWYLNPRNTAVKVTDGVLTISFPHDYSKGRVEDDSNLSKAVAASARLVGCSDVRFKIDDALRRSIELADAAEETINAAMPEKPNHDKEKRNLVSLCRQLLREHDTNMEHLSKDTDRYDLLVFGPCNEQAKATVEEVWRYFNTGQNAYSVAFISGSSATGKTAVLEGLAWKIQNEVEKAIKELGKLDPADPEQRERIAGLKKKAKFQVRYVLAQEFMAEWQRVGKSYKKGKEHVETETTSFEKRYSDLDVLMIDDVQFLTGKKGSTKDKLFEIINAMMKKGKLVIFASDRPYQDLKDLPGRLRTRMGSGARAYINYPDDETKKKVFYSYLKEKGHEINGSYDIDINALISRVPNFREVRGLVDTFCTEVEKLGKTYMEAILALKQAFPAASPKDDAVATVEDVIQIGMKMADAPDFASFRDARSEYITGIRRATIYLTYRLAQQLVEKSKLTNFLKSNWGYKKKDPIDAAVKEFEPLEDRGMITEEMIDPNKPAANLLSRVYGAYRDYVHKLAAEKDLPLLKGIMDEKEKNK